MIILNFILDYIVMIFLPIDTYFIVNDLDKNKIFNIILVGGLLDIMYHKLFIFLIILLSLYLIVRKMKIKNKYYYMKNIILFMVFFIIISLFKKEFVLLNFIVGGILQLIYMFIYKKLLK